MMNSREEEKSLARGYIENEGYFHFALQTRHIGTQASDVKEMHWLVNVTLGLRFWDKGTS